MACFVTRLVTRFGADIWDSLYKTVRIGQNLLNTVIFAEQLKKRKNPAAIAAAGFLSSSG